MNRRKLVAFATSGAGVLALTLAAWGGTALANSGGENPNQNDCQWNSDAWATPTNEVYPGCHNVAVNVETGNTTNGDADSTNTRYAEFGQNQEANDPDSKGTPTLLSIGEPGDTGSPHSGCFAVNDDGTDGGPAPAGTPPTSANTADNEAAQNNWGCGSNPSGAGFEANYDYYAAYCPIMAAAGSPCEDPSYASEPFTVTPDTGSNQAVTDILTQGLLVYFGMDDNTDNTEHDGYDGLDSTDGAINGPSDGGGMTASITPQNATNTPSATNPEGVANYSSGFCADGICGAATTQQQTLYYGCYDPSNPNDAAWTASGTDGADNPENNTADDQCASGTPESTDAYTNSTPSSTEESANCNSGGPDGNPGTGSGTEWPCYTNADGTPNDTSDSSTTSGPGCTTADNGNPPATDGSDQCGGANAYRQNTPQQVNSEPGVQTFQDPDSERSPAAPFGTPGTYVGTCGVYVNDDGGYGEPGVISTVTGGNVSPPPAGYVVGPTQDNC